MKKNNLFKNIGIVMCAWVKRYPTAWLLIPLFLFCKIISPYLNTLLSSKVIGAITLGDVKSYFKIILILLCAISVCSAVVNIVGAILQSQRTYTRMNVFVEHIAQKSLRTDYQNIELQKNQKIMGQAMQAVGANFRGPEELMIQTMNILVVILGIGTYGTMIFMIDWRILLAILGMFVFNVGLQSHALKYADAHRRENSEIWRKKNYINNKSMNVSAGKDIRIYQLKEWFHGMLCDVVNRRRKYEASNALRWYFGTISDVCWNFVRDFLAYTILIKKVLSGELDAASFTLCIGLVGNFSSWIYSLSGSISGIKRASHEFNDYHEFMNLPESEYEGDKVVAPMTKAPEVVFKNVGFTYDGADKATLHGLDFTIHAGEKIALVGNNGAGKTTIVKLLTGLYPQTEGEILIDGKSIEQIGLKNYQDGISVLFQDINPFAFSIKQNVASVEDSKIDQARVMDAIAKAGLAEKVESLAKKENTFITQTLDDDGILLSGGETQKLLLAKALYKNGSFLILDEPTSALDPIAESKIYEEYNEMSKGKTAVFISHRLASTKFCDKIMFLDNGKIAEFGTHEELMKLGGKYKEMFEIQSQYYM